ncbi:hypothetical protein [Thiomicrorhabdus sp.]|uniref:hypothetical protein n=1 Tax=Thiomicrorhabdus sp. TaxID=2039724 RepID=UPI0029C734D6|nr:hypothetical protein [Thiomicrorhabdus sp.]
MARTKLIKSFVHNLADSYMSTLGWVEGDYKSTWLYRSAMESVVSKICIDVRNSTIEPSGLKYETVLKKSLAGLNEHFDSMLASQGIEASYVPSLRFAFDVPELSKRELHLVCNASAVDVTGKEHVAAPIENKYGYEILAT